MAAFRNRTDAGRRLAKRLRHFTGRDDVIVLGLPRGGVPVAFEIATALNVPMDLFLVRKLGVPGREELAMGAVAPGGVRVLNPDVLGSLRLTQADIDSATEREELVLAHQNTTLRGGAPIPQLTDKTVILVDDGLATGASMRAAVVAVRAFAPTRVIVAVPTSARDTADYFRSEVDELVCITTPEPFIAVGTWYEDFAQISDEEVVRLLRSVRA